MSYKTTQKDSSINLEIKLMSRRILPKRDRKSKKKKRPEMLEMKNTIKEIKKKKTNLRSLKNRADIIEDRMSNLEAEI